LEQLQEAFFYFDDEQTGTIHIEELRDIVTRRGEPMTDLEEFLQEAMKFADAQGNIDYRSFASLMCSEGWVLL